MPRQIKEKKSENKRIIITLSVSPELYKKITEASKKYDMQISAFIRSAVVEKLERLSKDWVFLKDKKDKKSFLSFVD